MKLFVKNLPFGNHFFHLLSRPKRSDSHMERPRLLAKAGARYKHDATVIKQLNAIHIVYRHILFGSFFFGFISESNFRKSINGAFDNVTLYIYHLICLLKQ